MDDLYRFTSSDMFHVIQGNATQFWMAFNKKEPQEPDRVVIDGDLSRVQFLGTSKKAAYYLEQWKNIAPALSYLQGDMTAESLKWMTFPRVLFQQQNETVEEAMAQIKMIHLAYVNSQNELCGLMVSYRKETPNQWMIGLIKNTNALPEDKHVVVLSSFDPKYFMIEQKDGLTSQSTDYEISQFIQGMGYPFLEKTITRLFVRDDMQPESLKLNLKVTRLALLTQILCENEQANELARVASLDELDPDLLFAENRTLDLLEAYQLKVPFIVLRECIKKQSLLRKEIEALTLLDNKKVNVVLLKMIFDFYEQEILPKAKEHLQASLQQPLFTKTIQFFHGCLSEKAYYFVIPLLNELGLMQEAMTLFDKAEKREVLKYINTLEEENLKKLCLVFWVKADLSIEAYQSIVANLQENPVFAKMLLALDKTQTISIQALQKMAVDRMALQRESIFYEFSDEFKWFEPIQFDLKGFSEAELVAIRHSFSVLKRSGIQDVFRYQLALSHQDVGQKLRLFLPQFVAVSSQEACTTLVSLLYMGVQKSFLTQGKEIKKIEDKALLRQAISLRERFMSVTHLHAFGFGDEVTAFAAEETEKAARFRLILLKIESQIKTIKARSQKTLSYAAYTQIREAIDDYRKTVYEAVFNGFNTEAFDYKMSLHQAEAALLKWVDPEKASWIKQTLIIIANLVITFLTLGVANVIKEKKTGNFWFFTRTQSGEEITTLDNEVCQLMQPL